MSESFVLNEIARRIKSEFESNELLRYYFGDMKTPKWSESYFVLSNGIAFESCGIGGQLRGGRRGLICLDDLEDEDSAISEEQRDKLKRRINKELIPKLVKHGQIIYFGTPVHNLCYLHQLIQTPNNGWFKRVYPAYKNKLQEPGQELWTALFDHQRLQSLKSKLGTTYFSTEYLCDPISSDMSPIKDNQIKYWTEVPSQYSAVIVVDPAYTEDVTNDYKVCSLVGMDDRLNRYLLSYVRNHEPTGQFIDAIINMYLTNKQFVTALGLPHGAGDSEFFTSFMKRCEERKVYPPVVELRNSFKTAIGDNKRNKKARITAALQPLFEGGKYFIHANHMEAKDELLTLGNSRYDDLVDTMAYAEQLLQPVFFDNNFKQEEPLDMNKIPVGYGIEY